MRKHGIVNLAVLFDAIDPERYGLAFENARKIAPPACIGTGGAIDMRSVSGFSA
jgi:hypothetical protein